MSALPQEDSIGYAAILQGDDVLVETKKPGQQIAKIISLISEEVDMEGERKKGIYGNYNGLRFSYLVGDGFCFVVGCDESVQLRICHGYLEHIRKDFFYKFVQKGEKLKKGIYRKYMNDELQFFMTNKKADKLRGVIMETKEVETIMNEVLEKTLARGEGLETLQSKTKETEDIAAENFRQAKKLKWKKCKSYYFCCFASCCPCCDSC